jgi:hypothetical protein
MGCSFAAIINRENRRNKKRLHSIFIRIIVDRRTRFFNLKEKIEERHWSGRENRWIKDSFPFAFELNAIIRKKIDLLRQYEYRQKIFGNGISST